MNAITGTPDLGPVGVPIHLRPDGRHLDDAAELEDLGYRTLWVGGTELDRLDHLAELVRATRRMVIASGIVPAGDHSSDDVAALHRTVEAEHPGRLFLGIGAEKRPGGMAALDAYLDRLDAADPPVPAGRRILAALGPRRTAQARARSAGALALLVDPAWTAGARTTLGPDRLLVVHQFVVLDDDPRRARETARGPLRFLFGTAGYTPNALRMGFTEDDVATLDDRLLDALVAHGGPEDVARRVAEQRAAGADHVGISILGDDPMPAARELAGPLLG